jgi:hypothetical protein
MRLLDMPTRTEQEAVRAKIAPLSGSAILALVVLRNDAASDCNFVNNYVPPKGLDLIRSNGGPVRAEQKSVKLLQDIMRLFAPKPTEIVVELLAGTISTVTAAILEGLAVYACEKDPECFKIGESRVHIFQYRRGAAGLLGGLSPHQITLLRSAITSKLGAPDSLKHERDTYETELAEMEN